MLGTTALMKQAFPTWRFNFQRFGSARLGLDSVPRKWTECRYPSIVAGIHVDLTALRVGGEQARPRLTVSGHQNWKSMAGPAACSNNIQSATSTFNVGA